jgi:hypothetical protein
VDASAEDFRALVAWTHARYVVVHRQMLSAEQRGRIERVIEQVARVETVEGDVVLYRVNI